MTADTHPQGAQAVGFPFNHLTNAPEDAIAALIMERHRHHWSGVSACHTMMAIPAHVIGEQGRPAAPWHADTFERIDRLRAEGRSLQRACEQAHEEYARQYNVSLSSTKRAYQKFKSEGIAEEFHASVIDGDMPRAIALVRRMTEEMCGDLLPE